MPTLFLSLLLAVYPVKPDMSLKFSDIAISRAMSLAKTFGMAIDLPFKIEGRIGLLVIEFRGKLVTAKMERIQLSNDAGKAEMIDTVKATYNRHTSYWYVKALMLGGIVELEGVIPK